MVIMSGVGSNQIEGGLDNTPSEKGRIMGIDYGSKKVGIAISNADRTIGFPKEVLANKGREELIRKVLNVAKEEGVTDIVLGYSVDQKGKENPIMEGVRGFSNKIKRNSELTVHFEPETLTTAEAAKTGKKGNLDASAAALILQGFLERREAD